jgi:hypothetical protein
VVTSEAAYRGLADALGIKAPPPVNFRTHFLYVHVFTGYGPPQLQVVGGKLQAVPAPFIIGGYGAFKRKEDLSPRYLIKSFRRSAVKTVNGQPLPKD